MKVIYEEKIFSGLVAVIPGCIGIGFLVVFIYTQLTEGFRDPVSALLYFAVAVFLLLAALNFSFLIIKISADEVSTRFGVFNKKIRVDSIAKFYQDWNNAVAYGGYGVRFGWANGKWRMVYSIPRASRIVIQKQAESNREFGFSTLNPGGVIKALKEATGKK